MNSHNITNESLALALMLVVVAILISHKEKTSAGERYSLECRARDNPADYCRLCAEVYFQRG
ncbi:metal resistance protein [Escherichia coli]|nr:metal resistance protein [Escherichia coli]